jgi:hypothetical protein
MEQTISKETAWCPYCEIDSVIGDFDHYITIDFLRRMNEVWFSGSENISPEILVMLTELSQLLSTQHRS